ncbi:MAG: hypothetical protein EU532_00920 [Promethearchaeota archaeon]|nr:MAG: hypothetical protein EU532_00920 [Candidatus Lokiarchaeota archaeon]
MTELESNKKFLRFFRKFLPSEIHIDKNNIFYRDKYNEIINYMKLVIANSQDLELYQYVKPKGAILIHLNPGTDVVDFFKLISSNYYLEFFELNNNEILKTPEEFFNTFDAFIDYFNKPEQEMLVEKQSRNVKEKSSKKTDENKSNFKRLILIDQKPRLRKLFKKRSLLNNFINLFQTENRAMDFINSNSILIWLNYNYKELVENAENISEIFDLFIKIPMLNKIERETFLKDFSEKNPKIVFDINEVLNYTENWEVNDLKQVLKMGIFRHFLNSDLNDISNEITDTLINLIESGEFVLSNTPNIPEMENSIEFKQDLYNNKRKTAEKIENQKASMEKIDDYIGQIREEGISEFMLNQLYENAASKNYSELLIIIDKLNKKEPLEDHDRKLLAKYPFILNDSPNMAQINLEKAKKRIDLIKRAFGK